MYLMYLLILILCFKGSNSEISTYYGNFGGNFLCGCERDNQNDKNITMKCGDGQVIQMEPGYLIMRDSIRSNQDCGSFNYSICSTTFKPDVLNLEDRIEVYKKCSRQNSCNIKIGGVENNQQRLMNYPFYCHSELSIIDISQETVKTLRYPKLYLNGEKFTGQKIDCDCSVSGSDQIRLEIFFIHLKPNTSSRVRFLTQNVPLFESSINGITLLATAYGYIGPESKLEIRGMEPDKDDVIFFLVWGEDLFVKCSGCTNTTDSVHSPTDPTTNVHSTTDSVDSTADGHSPAASTDQTYYIFTLGGILGAVIIIVPVAISVYCCLRRRKKQQKTPGTGTNALDNDEQSHYEYVDMPLDGSTYLTVSKVVPSGESFITWRS